MRLTGAKGFVLGVGLLAGMQLLLSSKEGTKTFGIVATAPSQWLGKWLDPAEPLISDHRQNAGSGSGSSGSTSGGSDPCAGLFGAGAAACRALHPSSTATAPGPSSTLPPTSSTVQALQA